MLLPGSSQGSSEPSQHEETAQGVPSAHDREEWGIQRVKNSSYLTTLPLLSSISLPDCLWRKLNWFSSASEAFTVSEGS